MVHASRRKTTNTELSGRMKKNALESTASHVVTLLRDLQLVPLATYSTAKSDRMCRVSVVYKQQWWAATQCVRARHFGMLCCTRLAPSHYPFHTAYNTRGVCVQQHRRTPFRARGTPKSRSHKSKNTPGRQKVYHRNIQIISGLGASEQKIQYRTQRHGRNTFPCLRHNTYSHLSILCTALRPLSTPRFLIPADEARDSSAFAPFGCPDVPLDSPFRGVPCATPTIHDRIGFRSFWLRRRQLGLCNRCGVTKLHQPRTIPEYLSP